MNQTISSADCSRERARRTEFHPFCKFDERPLVVHSSLFQVNARHQSFLSLLDGLFDFIAIQSEALEAIWT